MPYAPLTCLLTCLLFGAMLGLASPAAAQEAAVDSDETTLAEQEETKRRDRAIFGASSIDARLHLGTDVFLFNPQLEASVDVGLLPLPAGFSLSVGGSAMGTYCVACLITELIGVGVRFYGIGINGRVFLHSNGFMAEVLDLPELDVYIGGVLGPALYRFTAIDRESSVSVNFNSVGFGFGPTAGVSWRFGRRAFVGAEARYLLQATTEVGTVNVGDESVNFVPSQYVSTGADYIFHIGVRF